MDATLAERFHAKVMPVPEAGCWLWTASTSKGYGQLSRGTGLSPYKAHRLSWELHRGPIPEGMDMLHKCDTPSCVNPDHLFVGTAKDNVDDMDSKGRRVNAQPKGVAHWQSKLTDDEVRAIRAATESQRAIGRQFGVHQTLVSLIKLRKIWKHVSEAA